MLIHGTLDDNVHYQQGALLAKALEREDIQFEQIVSEIHFIKIFFLTDFHFKFQSYTDEDHSLANVRPHLYHGLGRFLNDCFSTGR